MFKGLRRLVSSLRFSPSESVLGLTALTLVVWLLWPEPVKPELERRTFQRTPVASAEGQLPARERGQSRSLNTTVAETPSSTASDDQPAPVIERRLLAKPSEFADRQRYAGRSMPQARPETMPSRPAPLAVETPTSRENQAALAAITADDPEPRDAASQAIASLTVSSPPSTAPDPHDPAGHAHNEVVLDDAIVAAALTPPGHFVVESTGEAHVRKRPRDDAPSWLRHAVAARLNEDRPIIAVVIDDLGLNRVGTRTLNALPGPLTLAFLPYAGNIEAQTRAAREAGHELMVHLPMEPFGTSWPGPEALLTTLGQDEFVRRLRHNLDRISGYAGVNNHMGSRLTSDHARMDLVMRELRERDVLFLDSRTTPQSIASDMANRNGVPNTIRDIFLDHVIDERQIREQLTKVETIARSTGSAVAIGHPHQATIDALRVWLPTLAGRGFVLAPISAVVARRACEDNLLITAETCGQYLFAGQSTRSNLAAGDG